MIPTASSIALRGIVIKTTSNINMPPFLKGILTGIIQHFTSFVLITPQTLESESDDIIIPDLFGITRSSISYGVYTKLWFMLKQDSLLIDVPVSIICAAVYRGITAVFDLMRGKKIQKLQLISRIKKTSIGAIINLALISFVKRRVNK